MLKNNVRGGKEKIDKKKDLCADQRQAFKSTKQTGVNNALLTVLHYTGAEHQRAHVLCACLGERLKNGLHLAAKQDTERHRQKQRERKKKRESETEGESSIE